MSEKNETLADIVAQIRAAAYIQNADTPQSVLRLADRIEAARKREKAEAEALALSVGGMVEASRHKTCGNSAAMREAIVHMIDAAYSIALRESAGVIGKLAFHIMKTGDAALALPLRNCDVGTAEEQVERWKKQPRGIYHTLTLTDALEWAQRPYGKGGAK